MDARMWLSSMRCAKRRVVGRLAGAMSEIGMCLMPQHWVSPCDSPVRIIDTAGMQLNALVVERCLRLRTTGPRKRGCWRPIRSRARIVIECASPRHGYLGFIDVRPREPKYKEYHHLHQQAAWDRGWVLPGVHHRSGVGCCWPRGISLKRCHDS